MPLLVYRRELFDIFDFFGSAESFLRVIRLLIVGLLSPGHSYCHRCGGELIFGGCFAIAVHNAFT